MRDHYGKELKDNGCADVGHDAKRKYRELFQGTAGKHVEDPKDGPLHGGKEIPQRIGIDSWRRYIYANTINGQQCRSKENALPQLGNFKKIAETAAYHLDNLYSTTGRFDLLFCATADSVQFNG